MSMTSMLCTSRPQCGRDVQPNVAVDKLIRACSDPPVKYTVVRALGCAHGQAVLRVDGNLLVEERAAMSTPGWYQRLQGHA